jgi:hypothetical protein
MKRIRLSVSLTVLLAVFGVVGMSGTQSVSADYEYAGEKCDCQYVQSGNKGVQRWWYGEYTCHVEDCWLPMN